MFTTGHLLSKTTDTNYIIRNNGVWCGGRGGAKIYLVYIWAIKWEDEAYYTVIRVLMVHTRMSKDILI